MPLKIVLYQPEIPPNTGNIIRLCANTGAELHLVAPLGFALDDKRLKRAGLDYHEWADVTVHDSLDELLTHRCFAFTTKARRPYTEPRFEPTDTLIFGPETRGLPDTLLDDLPDENKLRIPMLPSSRSLNLSNAVAVGLYEVLRQVGLPARS